MRDVACGSGRQLRHFHGLGRTVTGIDRDRSGVADLAGSPGLARLQADLGADGPCPLVDRQFAVVVVTNCLLRPLLPSIVGAAGPGGWLLYETFA